MAGAAAYLGDPNTNRTAVFGRTAGPNTDHTPAEHDPNTRTPNPNSSRTARRILIGVAIALGVVVLAPIVLSAQDLFSWARAPRGLDLPPWFAGLVPLALDVAAAACIGMTVLAAAWKRERPGIFGLLVWVFALVSAYAQYTHGIAERDAGRAQDAWWAMPAFAVLGPLLLEVTLNRVRRWARQDAGEQHTGAAGFGSRWLPGVAFRETLAAWAVSRREGIGTWQAAVQFVRDKALLAGLPAVEAAHYAYGALGVVDPHTARVWLAARGVIVEQAALDTAAAGRPVMPVPVSAPPNTPAAAAPAPNTAEQWTELDTHAAQLAGLTTKRDRIRYAFAVIGTYDKAAAAKWLADRGLTVSRSEVSAVVRAAVGGPSGEHPLVDSTVSGPNSTT
jgi:hypothetical protein